MFEQPLFGEATVSLSGTMRSMIVGILLTLCCCLLGCEQATDESTAVAWKPLGPPPPVLREWPKRRESQHMTGRMGRPSVREVQSGIELRCDYELGEWNFDLPHMFVVDSVDGFHEEYQFKPETRGTITQLIPQNAGRGPFAAYIGHVNLRNNKVFAITTRLEFHLP